MKKPFITLIAVTFIAVASAPAFAQSSDPESQGAPPPSYQSASYPQPGAGPAPDPEQEQQPGVARISFISGDVSIQRGDSSDWVAATVNTPVAQGDRISTGPNARAEVQLDYANILRMDGNATVTLAGLARNSIAVQVGQGLVSYSILPNAEAGAEIDTPNVAVRPAQGEGVYRIMVNSDSDTQVTVRRGSADISTPQGSTRVDSGQMIAVAGADNPQYQTSQAYSPDDWDRWVTDRDRRIQRAASWRHTDRYYTGSEDLDANGQWQNVPDYGQVWTPNVAPGWSPYSSGSWVWEPYYGWTWVSYEPWGWAPYHYGRWFVYGDNWVWWPGPVAEYPAYYPIWAPAYVSFFGFGHGFEFGFSFGGFGTFGWLPLGPGDWCHPWWGRWGGRSETFGFRDFGRGRFGEGFRPLTNEIRGFRGREFSNLREAATNARVRSGMTTMTANRFGREAVNGHGRSISESEFRQASMMSGRHPATPTRASYSASGHAASASTIRGGSANSQRFFSASRGNSGGATLARGGFNNRGTSGSPSRLQPSGGLNRPASNPSGGFRGNTDPRSNQNSSRGAAASASRPGWHSFAPSGGTNRPTQAPTNRAPGNSPGNGNPRSFAPPNSGGRGQQPSTLNRGFGQPSANASPRGFNPPNAGARSPQPAAPNRSFAPPNGGGSPRGFAPPSNSRGGSVAGYSRPPLNMHQPVVTPRGGGYPKGGRGYSGGSSRGGGGSHGGGSHGGSGSHGGGGGGGSHGGGGGGEHHHR